MSIGSTLGKRFEVGCGVVGWNSPVSDRLSILLITESLVKGGGYVPRKKFLPDESFGIVSDALADYICLVSQNFCCLEDVLADFVVSIVTYFNRWF
ncbi:MAG: hypothetical protein SAL07_24775 [Oscillatoria sp. PMC 1051.18]|nr:hypothetical protein [Oscillatoria sp. PMC 1051.18]